MRFIWASMALIGLLLTACAQGDGATSDGNATGLANPASQHCVEQGGKSVIEARADGGQFGVCYFDDNRQCEEWALLRGDCPVGGLKVTGLATPAARYCVIQGGHYQITTAATDSAPEAGQCSLPDGKACAAAALYDGSC